MKYERFLSVWLIWFWQNPSPNIFVRRGDEGHAAAAHLVRERWASAMIINAKIMDYNLIISHTEARIVLRKKGQFML